jgi:hypothetical protein
VYQPSGKAVRALLAGAAALGEGAAALIGAVREVEAQTQLPDVVVTLPDPVAKAAKRKALPKAAP